MSKRLLCSAACSLAFTAAHGGTILETVSTNLTDHSTTAITTYAQAGRMRVESKPGDSYMIFKDDTLYAIDTREKSYVALDRAAAKRMAEQINPALKQMQEQLARMPPEQRAQIEKMMGPQMAGMTRPKKRDIRRTARSQKVGGHSCSYVELLEDGAVSDELCVAAAGTVPGSQELLDAALEMSAVVKEMFSAIDAPWLKDAIGQQIGVYDQIGGVPLQSRHYNAGNPVSETTLKSIRGGSVPASAFEVPAGYTKKDPMARR